ncbi:hypothetical protein AA0472_1133 [Acetobacter estunensis NRIC 0472]|uniref:Uncharacterized protein n=1 Tax=Acetobacter estunensis TaxID=104097 RepID=A0A967B3Y5_9PROT|nr:hypothetical protein [Acetobacter estunensis]NHO53300.1 hypothetical protein [Acetobacter estunensis]GBQ23539.1 hypothetical protein AA0472_1133 [Acetobacter estunensis NRIC 0472]
MIGHLGAIWQALSGPAEFAGTFLSGMFGNALRMRVQKRRERLEADQMALGLVASTTGLVERLNALLDERIAEQDALHRSRAQLLSILSEVQAQALAARLMVRELDEAAGRQPRRFDPLPPFPPDVEEVPPQVPEK